MNIHYEYMMEIQNHFQGRGICHYLQYTGSSYEGVKVRKTNEDYDLEFDVMMIIDKHKYELEAIPDQSRPGYASLKLGGNQPSEPGLDKVLNYWNFFGRFSGDRYVSSSKTVDTFKSVLQKLINDSDRMKGKVKLREHGPAVQMDVYPDSGVFFWGSRLYSVDIVPTYVVGQEMYVAKPIKGEQVKDEMTWRLSYSVQEKEKLVGGAKNVLRVLKVIRNREPGLAPLTSYHLKTTLFYEMDAEFDWSSRSLVLRLLGVLGRLEMSLSSGVLPHYFIKDVNLLSSMSSWSLSNMHDRIHKLRTKNGVLLKIFNS